MSREGRDAAEATSIMPAIIPGWPAPDRVAALVTTRHGGVSAPPFDSFNLGDHVGDSPVCVAANRERLQQLLPATAHVSWLRQVHGSRVVRWSDNAIREADACWTDQPGEVCAVLTADCLPVLFAARNGSCVAVAHAGWRGLVDGVLEATVAALPDSAGELIAWIGPAIGSNAFEVGDDVRERFLQSADDSEQLAVRQAFRAIDARPGKYLANLAGLARIRLARAGVTDVTGGEICTVHDARFYSYRRDGETGRFASLIWLQPD